MNEEWLQAEVDLDRLHDAVKQHLGLVEDDEDNAAGVDELVAQIERAGRMIEQYRAIYARVQVVAMRNGKCPLCEGGLYALDRSRPGRLEIVHSDTCPLYSEEQ